MSTCFFIGHREAGADVWDALVAAVEQHIVDYGVDSFTVGRYGRFDGLVSRALAAAKELSAYIHYTVEKCRESVWIAQREGRAKDSNDVTQESLLKMLTLGGDKCPAKSLADLNILPVSISYEFDPNDYLKAREFLLKRRDP